MKKKDKIENIKNELKKRSGILFAYLHGSALYSEEPGDIDIAVFFDPKIYKEFFDRGAMNIELLIPFEMDMERLVSGSIDLQALNMAPLSFQYRVVTKGELLIDNNEKIRCNFEYLSRVKYFDFRPRREEYLKEVLAS
jgi:predicted nucleotidyltransferase